MNVAQFKCCPRWLSVGLLQAALMLLMLSGGCAVSRPPMGLDPKPLLVHLPGIAGDNLIERWYLSSLRTGGFDGEMRLFDWTGRNAWFGALKAYDHNRDAGRRLAEEITTFVRANPDRPVFLSSDSGGAGPTDWALEALPDDVRVEGVVLICPALSPDYDLSPALARVRQRMIAFHSGRDGFILGWGTRQWGTIDRKYVAAAGYTGFQMPGDVADATQYQKLRSIGYDGSWWLRYNNPGDHTGAMSARFASGYIAPILTELAMNVLTPAEEKQ